jgi:hypothetical protein
VRVAPGQRVHSPRLCVVRPEIKGRVRSSDRRPNAQKRIGGGCNVHLRPIPPRLSRLTGAVVEAILGLEFPVAELAAFGRPGGRTYGHFGGRICPRRSEAGHPELRA